MNKFEWVAEKSGYALYKRLCSDTFKNYNLISVVYDTEMNWYTAFLQRKETNVIKP